MNTKSYFYPVRLWNTFELTENSKRLSSPIDLQFFIEVLMIQFGIYIYIQPCSDRKSIRAIIEKDIGCSYCAAERILRKYVEKHY